MKNSKLIICGKLFDGIHPQLRNNTEILIEGNRICGVGENLSRPAGADVIDLSHLTVTPGLIDAHVHGDLMRWQEMDRVLYQSEGYSTLAYLHTAQRCLERGFTTIRCFGMGPRGYGLVDVKNIISRGYFPGSRLVVAPHMMGGPGMPGDMSVYAADNPALSEAAQINSTGTGADYFCDAVRREVKYGSDFIKIFYSGSFGTPDGGPELLYLNDEELRAIIATAHALKKTVTAHVYPSEAVKQLLHLGIDGMEHAALMDEETARLFEESRAYLVPTFGAYQDIIDGDEGELSLLTEDELTKKRRWAENLRNTRRVICNSKIRLGFGSDFCVKHQAYESWYEFRAWRRSGMDPLRTLTSATAVNAGILGLQEQIGSIEVGKLADIAAWSRDLLQDEEAIRECAFVMKEGVIYPTGSRIVDDYTWTAP